MEVNLLLHKYLPNILLRQLPYSTAKLQAEARLCLVAARDYSHGYQGKICKKHICMYKDMVRQMPWNNSLSKIVPIYIRSGCRNFDCRVLKPSLSSPVLLLIQRLVKSIVQGFLNVFFWLYCVVKKMFEKPCMRHHTRLWMSRNTGL